MNAGSTVVVLGMHRSGTSLTVSLLQQLGLTVFDPMHQLPADKTDNPTGYGESWRVIQIDDAILAANGGSAWLPPPHVLTARDGLRMQIAQLLEDQPASDSTPILKDPRLCLTFESWRPHVQDPVFVVLIRHPLEVAESLATRNWVSTPYALALWCRYQLCALRIASGHAVYFANHRSLIDNPHELAADISNFLAARGIGTTAGRPSDVVRRDLWRHRHQTGSLWFADEIFDAMRDLVGAHDHLDDPKINEPVAVEALFEDHRAPTGEVTHLRDQVTSLERALRAASTTLEHHRQLFAPFRSIVPPGSRRRRIVKRFALSMSNHLPHPSERQP